MEMEIEIQEFYPAVDSKKEEFLGTMHIYAIINKVQIDLRGYLCWKRKGKLYIYPHTGSGVEDDGKSVRFPIFSLTDAKENDRLKKMILTQGRKFLNEKFKKKRG